MWLEFIQIENYLELIRNYITERISNQIRLMVSINSLFSRPEINPFDSLPYFNTFLVKILWVMLGPYVPRWIQIKFLLPLTYSSYKQPLFKIVLKIFTTFKKDPSKKKFNNNCQNDLVGNAKLSFQHKWKFPTFCTYHQQRIKKTKRSRWDLEDII